jgi:hypothetical protein
MKIKKKKNENDKYMKIFRRKKKENDKEMKMICKHYINDNLC